MLVFEAGDSGLTTVGRDHVPKWSEKAEEACLKSTVQHHVTTSSVGYHGMRQLQALLKPT